MPTTPPPDEQPQQNYQAGSRAHDDEETRLILRLPSHQGQVSGVGWMRDGLTGNAGLSGH